MTQDARPAGWARGAALGDPQALAVAFLLVALTAGTLLPRLTRQGPAFPIPQPIQVGVSEGLRPPPEVPAAIPSRSKPSPPAALDLNASDAQALQVLPGVGPLLAGRIVAYRKAHGPFRTPADLLQVPGIGPQRWGRIRDLVRVGGKGMTFQVKLEMFQGPLDLLLHLIREHQLDILDIPMAKITDEYLRTLALMQELDLDVAGEFLVMAATLIHIKSKMLLPPEETAEGEEVEEQDPRAELVTRLLEYKKFKEAAQTLGILEAEQLLLHRRGAPAMDLEVEGPLQVSMFELLRAFRDILQRADVPTPIEITPEELSVGQRIVVLLDRLAAESPLEFTSIFSDTQRRVEIIVTFLSLLELLRRRLATARQAEPLGPIMIYRAVERDEDEAAARPLGEPGGRGADESGG